MSREVQGDAPADAAVATATRTSGTPGAAPPTAPQQAGPPGNDPSRPEQSWPEQTWAEQTWPEQTWADASWESLPWLRALRRSGAGSLTARLTGTGPGRWRLPRAMLAVALTGALGWLAAGAWQPPPPPPPPEAVSAAVLDARADGNRPTPVRGRMRVVVQNDGDHPVSVVGFEPPRDSGFVMGLDPRRLEVPAGGRADLVLQFAVRCGAATPLDLPALRIRRSDGGLRPVPLAGATDALATMCAGWPQQEPLVLDSVDRDGDRLRLRLRVPGGRSTRLDEAFAGAVRLVVAPLPAPVDGAGKTFWLEPPRQCPVRWQQTGIPRTLTLQGDLGGPATLTLTVGPLMSDWILDTTCTSAAAG